MLLILDISHTQTFNTSNATIYSFDELKNKFIIYILTLLTESSFCQALKLGNIYPKASIIIKGCVCL